MKDKYLLKNVGLSELTRWLVENKKKKENGTRINISDVQQYAYKVHRLPKYMGGNIIEVNSSKFYKKTFNLLKNGEI